MLRAKIIDISHSHKDHTNKTTANHPVDINSDVIESIERRLWETVLSAVPARSGRLQAKATLPLKESIDRTRSSGTEEPLTQNSQTTHGVDLLDDMNCGGQADTKTRRIGDLSWANSDIVPTTPTFALSLDLSSQTSFPDHLKSTSSNDSWKTFNASEIGSIMSLDEPYLWRSESP
jgi:hypothetical protein